MGLCLRAGAFVAPNCGSKWLRRSHVPVSTAMPPQLLHSWSRTRTPYRLY